MSRADALEAAEREPDPDSLAAGARLRRDFEPHVAAWALTQVGLRRRAAGKLERAGEMLFTSAGLEQATRSAVARWRAERFADAGVRRVWDIGCGVGSDAMAFAEAGLDVVAVDADPETAEVASHNLALVGAGPAVVARAEDLDVPAGDAVFLDPARRTVRGRTWNVADFTPPWELVLGYLESERFVAVKLGPGVPKELLPAGTQWAWVSDGGDVVEASVWNRLAPGPVAVQTRPRRALASGERDLDVRPVGRFVGEPDGAAIRAGLVAEAVGEADAWLLDEHVAYLSGNEPIPGGWVTNFEVVDVLDYTRKALKAYVREHRIGTLEIKKRAIDVDPAELRRALKPTGANRATIIIARTQDGTKAIVARRR
ncbi:MAG: class I SAM-dependent methyltransferase [Propionibacterium sp.]|nr:class I SAM-dependent methyltransferase [Propionibacterium sp.]